MVKITQLAAQKIKEVLKEQNKENALLRLYLVGTGCSGPSFGMALEEIKTEDDIIDEEYGVSVVIDIKLSNYLEGATVDYVETNLGGGFEIRRANPDSGGACGDGCCGGCGSSGSC